MAVDAYLRDASAQLRRALTDIDRDIQETRREQDDTVRLLEDDINQLVALVRTKDQEVYSATDDTRKAQVHAEIKLLNDQIDEKKQQVQDTRSRIDRQNSHREDLKRFIESYAQEIERLSNNLEPR